MITALPFLLDASCLGHFFQDLRDLPFGVSQSHHEGALATPRQLQLPADNRGAHAQDVVEPQYILVEGHQAPPGALNDVRVSKI